MAIRIIEGAIGSGKTYYAVKHVVDNYFKWSKEREEWIAREGVDVYTNIEGFKLGKSLDEAIKQAGGTTVFFNVTFQKQFFPENKRVIYIIDEAQAPHLFHRKFYDADTFFFFQWSRHMGIDIYLLTQDISTLAKELQNLAEYHIQVKRRTLTLMGEFSYRFVSGGESFRSKTLKPEKRIFALYKSMLKGEVEKLPSAPRRWALVFGVLLLCAGFLFYYVFLGFLLPNKSKIKQEDTQGRGQTINTAIDHPGVSGGVQKALAVQNEPEAYKPSLPKSNLYTIRGLIGESNDASFGFVLLNPMGKNENITLRMTRVEFDSFCRCDSFVKYRSGDIITIPD